MPSKVTSRQSGIRQEFLKHFVGALIYNSLSPEEKMRIIEEERERRLAVQRVQARLASQVQRTQFPQRVPIQISPPNPAAPQIKFRPPQSFPKAPPQKPMNFVAHSPVPLPAYSPSHGAPINLGRLTQILVDPAVLSVECPGIGKNLLVNRSGAIQTSQIVLTEEEVNSIMKEISDRTRIPLISGVFKAAFEDLIMTAVISEYVGTRFIIQKRTPFQH